MAAYGCLIRFNNNPYLWQGCVKGEKWNMTNARKIYLVFFLVIISLSTKLGAQFYYGHQMNFGKSRVQYNDFYWYYFRYEKFDAYFNQQGKALANYVSDYLSEEINRLENFFDYTLDNRIIFIVYNKLTDFRQSNIGLVTGKDEYNTGGVTKIIRNKVFIYFDGDHKKLEEQISAAVAEVLINEMLYGNQFRENITNSTLINLPDWYLKGLISYVSRKWDFDLENMVKDGILNNRFGKFNQLTGDDAVYAGHSFWKFVADTYGESVIPNILYLTRINKNSNSGFLYVLGFSIKDLSSDWKEYYLNMFDKSDTGKDEPQGTSIKKHTRKKRVYNNIRISPSGDYIAYVTNESGQYRLWLYNTKTDRHKQIIKREHKLDQIPDFTYPVIAWHPSGKILTFVTEEEGGLRLYYYTLETKELTFRNMPFFEKILDYSFSNDGLKLVMSSINRGQTDIYVHTISAGTNEQITNDIFDDFQPRFINNGNDILFISNRPDDTTNYYRPGEPVYSKYLTKRIFTTDYPKKTGKISIISSDKFFNDTYPYETGPNKYVYLSDKNGLINRYVAKYDSTIAFIDTTIHYRFFSRANPLTNYKRNILEQDISRHADRYAEVIYKDGRYKLFEGDINNSDKAFRGVLTDTEFRDKLSAELMEHDSLKRIQKETIAIKDIQDNQIITSRSDTLELGHHVIDVNNYVFELEKINYYNEKFKNDNLNLVIDTSSFIRPTPRIYETAFYTNFLANQIDFSFLNASYQMFTGGAVYYNPGFNMLFKLGTNDLFEDYKITGGVRFAADFDSNEFLLSIENLKRRLDKQLIFHRQVFKQQVENSSGNVESYIKTFSHNLDFVLRWPFNQVSVFEGTLSMRQDKNVYLSTDIKNMIRDDFTRIWGGVKLAYIFDNTRNLGTNLYQGTRFKLFAEAYQQINGDFSDLYSIGGDFRHYVKIHRTLIWANRFAAGASFGKSRLIYYLGSVDNWINFSSKVQTFDKDIPIDYSKNYVYQTLSTNMRGFTQNIRNGDRFAVANTELRWPVIRYFANHPISSNFWNNFMLAGFYDIGTAWSGPHPWARENAYDNEILENGPITVIIDADREPIVMGFGAGLRSMLLGYFIRLDWAWGIENNILLPRIFYFSLSLDF